MTDFRAIVAALDTTPNDGDEKPRPLARDFKFRTQRPLKDVEAPGSIRVTELRNVQVGETIQIFGPGYSRFYELVGKQGEFVTLQRTGSNDEVDPVVCGTLTIEAGEVHGLAAATEATGDAIKAARVSVTPVNCDVPWWTTFGDDGLSIDIETASAHPVVFAYQVFP